MKTALRVFIFIHFFQQIYLKSFVESHNSSATHEIVKRWTNEQECGTTLASVSLIIGGETFPRGEWPFAVAVFEIDENVTKFICGGTIISRNHILTGKKNKFQSKKNLFSLFFVKLRIVFMKSSVLRRNLLVTFAYDLALTTWMTNMKVAAFQLRR
jgi:Trypsin